jgi:hypothetical protein
MNSEATKRWKVECNKLITKVIKYWWCTTISQNFDWLRVFYIPWIPRSSKLEQNRKKNSAFDHSPHPWLAFQGLLGYLCTTSERYFCFSFMLLWIPMSCKSIENSPLSSVIFVTTFNRSYFFCSHGFSVKNRRLTMI